MSASRIHAWWLPLALLLGSAAASAQSLPVSTEIAGNTATVQVGTVGIDGNPLADLTFTFDEVSGLTPQSLGVSAKLVDLGDSALLARLPQLSLSALSSSLPLMVTVEPPATGGLSFRRSGRFELHTHALAYTAGSSLRVFKAPLGGRFRDVTEEIAPGSVRARSRYGGFSQFLLLVDVRETSTVIGEKIAYLRDRVDALPAGEQGAFDTQLDGVEAALDARNFAGAIAGIDAISARASERAGTYIPDVWRAARDVENLAGELIAGAATLKFSVAYLRDYGE
jgi:hypothetical protein